MRLKAALFPSEPSKGDGRGPLQGVERRENRRTWAIIISMWGDDWRQRKSRLFLAGRVFCAVSQAVPTLPVGYARRGAAPLCSLALLRRKEKQLSVAARGAFRVQGGELKLRGNRLQARLSGVLAVASCSVAMLGRASAAEDTAEVAVDKAKLAVTFSEPPSAPLRQAGLHWIAESARAVTVYLGHFPIERVRIRIRMRDGHGASNGTTYGWHGGLITLSLGRGSTADDFAEDWLMTHEMLHLGFPSVPEQHHWIEEGISTYVEPIARCRAGLKTPEAVWKELMDGLPRVCPNEAIRAWIIPPLGGAPTGAGRSSAS